MRARDSLERLRPRLTVWYAGSFAAILLLLGAGLFLMLLRDKAAELDRALEQTVAEVLRATSIRLAEGADAGTALADAREELESPDRILYVIHTGSASTEQSAPAEVVSAANQALTNREIRGYYTAPDAQKWRFYGERFVAPGAAPVIVLAMTDTTPLERHYARLIELFVAFGLASLAPIVLGGYQLARLSSAPALERLKQFTADAAHELRTPLSVVRATTEIAIEGERSADEYRSALAVVAQEGERLGEIVDDLLLLARSDAGSPRLNRELVYLDDLASEAVSAAAALAQSRGVKLSLGTFEEAAVQGDRVLLRRLVMILLDNAIKFTPAGKAVRLDVGAQGGSVTLVVEDQGIGISPGDLPRIFDRFYRAENARGQAGGTGLGLAIARHVAEAHGARIRVTSQAGHGTRFTVVFPQSSK